jgi:hypothetical protein
MKTELTLWQRILRKPLNFIIEKWFPNGAFYGNEFLEPFTHFDERKDKTGAASALFLVSKVKEHRGTGITVTLTDVFHQGENIGTWEVIVQEVEETK